MGKERLKILILCKEGETLELLAKAVFLKYPTSRLFFAQTDEEGLRKHEQSCPEILILMPDQFKVEAVDLVSELFSIHQGCSVLLITRCGSGNSVSRCLELGVKDVLTTPLNVELFLCKLAVMIRLHGEEAGG